MAATGFTGGGGEPFEMIIALLGRREQPTDGVADYCRFLGEAFARRGVPFETAEVPWAERGWGYATQWLRERSRGWRGQWVLFQYTALSWSRRGIPWRAPRVLRFLQRNGVRCAVVFHDAFEFQSPRLKDRVRVTLQYRIMRKLYERADRSILTVNPRSLPWMPADQSRASFIPIGANVPSFTERRTFDLAKTPKVIAVFSVTDAAARSYETDDIAAAARAAQLACGPIRLEVFGRGAENARELLERKLASSGVELRVQGLLPPEQIKALFATADVSLFVRGLTESNRGTAIAGIVCGVPMAGYGRPGDDPAIDSAGVRLAPWRETETLAGEVVRVLKDSTLWRDLHERSLRAEAEYFSWDAVAGRFSAALQQPEAAQ